MNLASPICLWYYVPKIFFGKVEDKIKDLMPNAHMLWKKIGS
jgi:hypothetical protein